MPHQALQLSLGAITASRPFFMALIGTAYGEYNQEEGWVSGTQRVAVERGHGWVRDAVQAHGGCSLLELEVLHAALRAAEDPTSGHLCCREAFFYFREDKWDGFEGYVAAAASPEGLARVKALKTRIQAAGLTVRAYSSLQELGDHILRDWHGVLTRLGGVPMGPKKPVGRPLRETRAVWEALDRHAQGVCATSPRHRDPSSLPEVPAEERRCLYPRSQEGFFTAAEESAARAGAGAGDPSGSSGPPHERVLVVEGCSGSGKSLLLGEWAEEWHARHPHAPMIYLRVGESRDASLLPTVLHEFSEVPGSRLPWINGDHFNAI